MSLYYPEPPSFCKQMDPRLYLTAYREYLDVFCLITDANVRIKQGNQHLIEPMHESNVQLHKDIGILPSQLCATDAKNLAEAKLKDAEAAKILVDIKSKTNKKTYADVVSNNLTRKTRGWYNKTNAGKVTREKMTAPRSSNVSSPVGPTAEDNAELSTKFINEHVPKRRFNDDGTIVINKEDVQTPKEGCSSLKELTKKNIKAGLAVANYLNNKAKTEDELTSAEVAEKIVAKEFAKVEEASPKLQALSTAQTIIKQPSFSLNTYMTFDEETQNKICNALISDAALKVVKIRASDAGVTDSDLPTKHSLLMGDFDYIVSRYHQKGMF